VEKNCKWSCIYVVGSQEYQMVCTRLDIASADVGMLDDRGLQTDVQVFVNFDYAMSRSITNGIHDTYGGCKRGYLAKETHNRVRIRAKDSSGFCYTCLVKGGPWIEQPVSTRRVGFHHPRLYNKEMEGHQHALADAPTTLLTTAVSPHVDANVLTCPSYSKDSMHSNVGYLTSNESPHDTFSPRFHTIDVNLQDSDSNAMRFGHDVSRKTSKFGKFPNFSERNVVTTTMSITGSIHQATKCLLDKAKGNILAMEIVRDQSGNALRVSQSRFYNTKLVQTFLEGHFILSLEGSLSGNCDVEKNCKGSCIYVVGSQEYQMVCTRLDIASADVDTGSVQVLQGVEFEVESQEDHTFEVKPHGIFDHVAGSQEVQTQDLIYYHPTRDREQHLACELLSYIEDSNEAAFAVTAVDKI
nr:zinc finger, CCHC-type [Tanacetum cinerariifolium]